MVFGWLCIWTFHFLFLFWVCCCQKWQIWQNGDTFNLLVPMPSDRSYYIFWGDLESRNPEQNERGLNYRWESVWLLHNPKSRVANCWISSMCLFRAALTPSGSDWNLILCLQDSVKTRFSGLTLHTHPVNLFNNILFQLTFFKFQHCNIFAPPPSIISTLWKGKAHSPTTP